MLTYLSPGVVEGYFMASLVFGERLRELRLDRDLTLEQIEELSGLSYVTVGDWERGKKNPRPANLTKVANVLSSVSPISHQDREELFALAGFKEKPLTYFDAGDTIRLADDLSIKVIWREGKPGAPLDVPDNIRAVLESIIRLQAQKPATDKTEKDS